MSPRVDDAALDRTDIAQFKECSDDEDELGDHLEGRIIDQNVVAGNPHCDLGIGSAIKLWIDRQRINGFVKTSVNHISN
jgi:hypothetical protein